MKEKRFFVLTMAIIFASLLLIGGVGYWIDFYGVFRGVHQEVIESNQINDRFVKIEYLLRNKNYEKYDSFLWGSSRVKKTDPGVTGKHTYNMGEDGGFTQDCLQELSLLLGKGCKPKIVYLGLDDISYRDRWEQRIQRLNSVPYSEDIMKRGSYYGDLVFNSQLIYLGCMDRWQNKEKPKNFLYENGVFLVPGYVERNIEKDPHSYVADEKFQKPSGSKRFNERNFNDCMQTIRKIKRICDTNGIQFVPFFNPQHIATYFNNDIKVMNRFKRELVKISPFWDFSGVNYVTTNNYFWYETSHPRAFICDKILDTVSGQHQISWVPDFGVYVTKNNVDAFCEKAVRDRESYDPKHEQWIPTAEERRVMTKRLHYPW